jgi:hypothetical protein
MEFLKKAKEAAQQAQQAFAQPQQGQGMVHVAGAGPMDPAVLGVPSTRSVAADDPIWQPINGISLQDYAELQGRARRLGAANGSVDGRRPAVPHVPRLLSAALTVADVGQNAQQVVWVVPHEVVRAVQLVDVPVRIVLHPFV